jgi:hypothetical protein
MVKPITQAELAQQLGISGALVSKLRKRGMPVDDVEAARQWRRRNVAPYAKCPAPPPAPVGRKAAAGPAKQQPLAELLSAQALADPADVIEALVAEFALIPHELLPALLVSLDAAVHRALERGRDPAFLRPAICQMLVNLPEDERLLTPEAWDVATGL